MQHFPSSRSAISRRTPRPESVGDEAAGAAPLRPSDADAKTVRRDSLFVFLKCKKPSGSGAYPAL
jgi:hypothetical protein